MSIELPVILMKAFRNLLQGKPVIIHDGDDREGECDLVYLADQVTYRTVTQLRNEAGGLICACLPNSLAQMVGIPFFEDVLIEAGKKFPILESLNRKTLDYDTRSSFSITINHRETRTGIPDKERARTLQELAHFASQIESQLELAKSSFPTTRRLKEEFTREFYSPGHVFLLIGASRLTKERQGHTELSLALARMATGRRFPITVICEMLDDSTGMALSVENAKKWAEKNEGVVIFGHEIIKAYDQWTMRTQEDLVSPRRTIMSKAPQ